jgi:hypothetical protein
MDSYVVTYTVWEGNKPQTREINVETPYELWTSVFGASYHKVDIKTPTHGVKAGEYARRHISAFSDDPSKFASEVDELLVKEWLHKPRVRLWLHFQLASRLGSAKIAIFLDFKS